MGIDQVAQVGQIVTAAITHRRDRSARSREGEASGSPAGGQKRAPSSASVQQQLTQLDQPLPPRGPEESLRGQENFGRTRRIVASPASSRASGRPAATSSPALLQVNHRPGFIPDVTTPRYRLTPPHFAYLKIAEGCNHPCSFCIIPRMRGTHRSRTQADVVAEARQLIAQGVKELNLISQDSTYYGLDLRPGHSRNIASPEKFTAATQNLSVQATSLCSLLRELDALEGEFWIRLLYTHPAHWTDDLIGTIASCRKLARYVDMPLQHIHPNMLQRMRRETSREYIIDLISRIRAGIPGIALRTTFIVGFPGETEACFESLLEFIRATRFERLGVFTYSKEEGTRAAGMAGHVSQPIKMKRRQLAMAEQQRIAREISASLVGRTLPVLAEHKATAKELQSAQVTSWEHGLLRQSDPGAGQAFRGRYLVARSEADAPDIDGRVYVRGSLPVGQFARVRIVGHTDYDLLAAPA
ncbi:MAG TPA: MiaB/RimO family radical SAM methylthiotransferase [Candidatus Dormibacteraeota bacterium]|nr:MiaB/RimO family radical SAM methylthiotransferase [Candidatus Dormibacteraeota bacterium]